MTQDTLIEIYGWMEHGATLSDVIDRLRPRTVPSGYTYSMWKLGKITVLLLSLIALLCTGEEESLHTKLKSILAQMEYVYQIRSWKSKGVPFDVAMYVPEYHPASGAIFYEQEDAGHLLKVTIIIELRI